MTEFAPPEIPIRTFYTLEDLRAGGSNLESFIGGFVTVYPQNLLNRKLLYTDQGGTDRDKTRRAMHGDPDLTKEPPSARIFLDKKGKVAFVITDGNHRTGLAAAKRESIDLKIVGLWDPNTTKYGFNMITQTFENLIAHSSAKPDLY